MTNKINQLVNEVGEQFKNRNLTLVTAESCSGGGLSYFISINPHYSSLLERGYVTYSNQAKTHLLNVTLLNLQTHGPVSKEVAIAMSEGALENSNAQIAIAITGLAGPDCTPEDHAHEGLVWIACSSKTHKTEVKFKKIRGQRRIFCRKVIEESLKFLLSYVKASS